MGQMDDGADGRNVLLKKRKEDEKGTRMPSGGDKSFVLPGKWTKITQMACAS